MNQHSTQENPDNRPHGQGAQLRVKRSCTTVNRAGALYETGLNDASGAAAADWAVVFNQKEGAAAEAERQLALEKERHVDDSAAALQMFENIHRSRPFRA